MIMGSTPGTVYWMDVRDANYYINTKITKKRKRNMGSQKKIVSNFFTDSLKSYKERKVLKNG
jgi:hypothetical protein